jgi:glycosyltransferase involved in cell wall biosynthesis
MMFSEKVQMKISLIICTRNRASQLANCLKSLLLIECQEPWELVIVDNGSTDNTSNVIEQFRTSFTGQLAVVMENLPGLARARNRGWRAAKGELIAFTDDDCYPDPKFLQSCIECFAEDAKLGFIGGRILLHDPTDYRITIQESEEKQKIPVRSFINPGLIQGANFACRREALESVNGFDELLGAGTKFPCEDVDILARMSGSGWLGEYDPRPLVYHHHQRKTAAEAAQLMSQYDQGRGAYYVKCLANSALRRVYIKNLYWKLRSQSLGVTYREFSSAIEYLAIANFHK